MEVVILASGYGNRISAGMQVLPGSPVDVAGSLILSLTSVHITDGAITDGNVRNARGDIDRETGCLTCGNGVAVSDFSRPNRFGPMCEDQDP
jgi:hypothetical protein